MALNSRTLPLGRQAADYVHKHRNDLVDRLPVRLERVLDGGEVLQLYHPAAPLAGLREPGARLQLAERHAQGFTSEEDKDWSVWKRESFLELCDHLGMNVLEHQDPDSKIGNGFAVVIDASA
jgi:hypothetical protein